MSETPTHTAAAQPAPSSSTPDSSSAASSNTAPEAPEYHDDTIRPGAIPFVIVHLACFGALWTGVSAWSLALCFVLYVVRMFAITGGYHRYFSHRSFKTSRAFQFILALLAQSSAQRGVLWWAAKHRDHHTHSDTEFDVHSPRHRGFWYSHLGWIFQPQNEETNLDRVKDLSRFSELVWLDRREHFVGVLAGALIFLVFGWEGLVVGFLWSTVLLYHCTFFINSLAHVVGKQRYLTGDDSRNNWWLAFITLGEGWHNNHHRYMTSTRQGFRWWEVDFTYYILKSLSWCGIVWDLREPPRELVFGEEARPSVVDRVANQLVESLPVDKIRGQIAEAWSHKPSLEELREKARTAWPEFRRQIAELELPHLPTKAELRKRADRMFARNPNVDIVVQRAQELLLEKLFVQPQNA